MTSAALIANVVAASSDDPYLDLLTITHPDLPETLRWVCDKVAIVSRGNTYAPFPFGFAPPAQGDAGVSPARIVIDNIDLRMSQTIRALSTPPLLKIESVLRSDPDTVEEEWPPYRLYTVTGDYTQIEGQLVNSANGVEAAMQWAFSPATAPALF